MRDAAIAESVIRDDVHKFIKGFQIAYSSGQSDVGGARAEREAIKYVLERRSDLYERTLTMADPSRVFSNRWVNTALIVVDSLRGKIVGRIDREVRKALTY